MTFDQFCADQKSRIEYMLTHFEPDEDLLPLLCLFDGSKHFLVPVPTVGDPAKKQFTAAVVIPSIISQMKAIMGSIAAAAWTTVVPALPNGAFPERYARPSEDPNRIEVVTLSCFQRNREVASTAEVIRDPANPPRIKPWEDCDDKNPAHALGGLFSGFGRFTRLGEQ